MLIILDRDGVINIDSINYIKSPQEWQPIPGSLEAIAKLKRAGHTVVVASNQSAVARGYVSITTLANIHHKMLKELAKVGGQLDGIFFCPHGPDDDCWCRKPKPGLFLLIAALMKQDLTSALAIGDSLRDIKAAQAANCPSILVETGNGKEVLAKHVLHDSSKHLGYSKNGEFLNPIGIRANLASAVDALLSVNCKS